MWLSSFRKYIVFYAYHKSIHLAVIRSFPIFPVCQLVPFSQLRNHLWQSLPWFSTLLWWHLISHIIMVTLTFDLWPARRVRRTDRQIHSVLKLLHSLLMRGVKKHLSTSIITNSDLNRPCFAWRPYGKSGLFKTELVIVGGTERFWYCMAEKVLPCHKNSTHVKFVHHGWLAEKEHNFVFSQTGSRRFYYNNTRYNIIHSTLRDTTTFLGEGSQYSLSSPVLVMVSRSFLFFFLAIQMIPLCSTLLEKTRFQLTE